MCDAALVYVLWVVVVRTCDMRDVRVRRLCVRARAFRIEHTQLRDAEHAYQGRGIGANRGEDQVVEAHKGTTQNAYA